MDDTEEKDMTLISPCTCPGNSHPRKGHSCGAPFPPFSNLVGMEQAWGNFTINQSSVLLLRKQRGAGSRMTELELLLGCDVRSGGNPHGIPAHGLLIIRHTFTSLSTQLQTQGKDKAHFKQKNKI